MVEKVSKMKPVPPCDNLFDLSWSKVDKLIIKMMKAMKEKGEERPLHNLSVTLGDMSSQDVIDHKGESTPAVQAVAYRALDTRLLVDEFGRMREMAVAIRAVAQGQDVKVPSPHFPPNCLVLIPPCFDEKVYDDSAAGIVWTFAEELRKRGVLPPRKQE
jgi:hypothetical protein